MAEAGYDADMIDRVRDLLRKRGVKSDPERQTLEDAACLVFLENGVAEFARKHDAKKIKGILCKTRTNMSEAGGCEALKLDLPEEGCALVADALA
jgi:hypothetical protein